MLQDHLECLERALNAMAWLYHTGKLQQWGGLPSTGESVEKVAAGAFDAPESGSKRLKTGSRQPNQGSEKGTEKFSTGSSLLGNSVAASRKLTGFSGTARVDKMVSKCANVFFHYFKRPVQLESLNKATICVIFRIFQRDLPQSLQPIPHQLRLTQFLDHLLLSRYRILLFSLHRRVTSRLAAENVHCKPPEATW
jgi:hypothetical protein